MRHGVADCVGQAEAKSIAKLSVNHAQL